MLNKFLRYVIFALYLWGATAHGHEFYVSLSQIDYNPENAALEIAVKIFSDDLEAALTAYGAELENSDLDSSATANRYIDRYLQRCLIIEDEGKKVTYQYLGSESEMDVVWCYLEAVDVPQPASLTITNTLLIDIYEEQLNIVHLTVGDEKKSLMLSKNTPSKTVTFAKDANDR